MARQSGRSGKGASFELRGLLLPDKTASGDEEEDAEEEDGDYPEPLADLPEDSSQLSFAQPSSRRGKELRTPAPESSS